MVTIKSDRELNLMRHAGKILAETMALLEERIEPGVTTGMLENIAHEYITKQDAWPSFKNYNGYPGSICTSVNEEVVHGIPGHRKLNEGDIVGIDIGVCYGGYHADAARTFGVGEISHEARRLITVTEASFFEGVKLAKEGMRLGDIGNAIQVFVEENGFSVVRELIGHGVGSSLHEEPDVPNYGHRGKGIRLLQGMTLAVEPMVNAGGFEVCVQKDGWTFISKDHTLSAHYENTIIVHHDDCEIITKL